MAQVAREFFDRGQSGRLLLNSSTTQDHSSLVVFKLLLTLAQICIANSAILSEA